MKLKCGLDRGILPGGEYCEHVAGDGISCLNKHACPRQRTVDPNPPKFLLRGEDGPEIIPLGSPAAPKPSTLDEQVGGDHYRKLGAHQPWEVLRAWLTPEEFRGYMKGQAIAYLARERDKGGDEDIAKAAHYLRGLLELGGDRGR